MFELRPLIVVTGTISARGGETVEVVSREGTATKSKIVRRQTKSKSRLAASVISSEYMRRLRKIRLVDTPYGALFESGKLQEIQAILDEANTAIGEWNKANDDPSVSLVNGCVLETLDGNRLAAVRGWAMFNKDVKTRIAA
jgi:hypothetical protein